MAKPPVKRKLKDLFAPRDATDTSRQGQGIGDIEAMRQMLTVPAGAARKVVQDAGTQQREAFGRMLSGAATQDDMTDMASDFMLPMAGSVENVAAKAVKPAIKAATDALIRTWHASKSDIPFPKFQREYFGTGSGGDRLGPGVYSGNLRGRGENYLESVKWASPGEFGAKVLLEGGESIPVPYKIATQLKNNELPLQDMVEGAQKKLLSLEEIRRGTQTYKSYTDASNQASLLESLQKILAGKIKGVKRPGTLMELGLDVSPEQLINFDKELVDQSSFVQDAIKSSLGIKPNPNSPKDVMAFRELLNRGISTKQLDPTQTVKRLEDAGIQGVTARPTNSLPGEGAIDYAVFNPDRAKILRAMGILGMLTGAGAAGKASQTPNTDKPRRF